MTKQEITKEIWLNLQLQKALTQNPFEQQYIDICLDELKHGNVSVSFPQ